MAEIEWVSEAERLPLVGRTVLLVAPVPGTDLAEMTSAVLAALDEAGIPSPVQPGDPWPDNYCWVRPRTCRQQIVPVTGYGYWGSLTGIPLPPGFKRVVEGGRTYTMVDKGKEKDHG